MKAVDLARHGVESAKGTKEEKVCLEVVWRWEIGDRWDKRSEEDGGEVVVPVGGVGVVGFGGCEVKGSTKTVRATLVEHSAIWYGIGDEMG